jgi:hypothetical protein
LAADQLHPSSSVLTLSIEVHRPVNKRLQSGGLVLMPRKRLLFKG